MISDTKPDLAGLCADLAAELEDVTTSVDGDATAYARAGALFARVGAGRLEVRLPDDIAEAAVRTPDTALDPERGGWLVFTPPDSERHVIDRASAWFRTGWRHAEDRRG